MSNQSKAMFIVLNALAIAIETVYNAGVASAPHIKRAYNDSVAYYQLYMHQHVVNGLKASVAATIVVGQYAASTAATLYANRKQIRNSVEALFVYRNTPALA